MVESAGPRQVTEYNTFILHENVLKLLNTADRALKVDFSIFDYNHTQLPLPAGLESVTIESHGSKSVALDNLPRDSYGTVVARVREGGVGLIMVNEIQRKGAYVMPFVAR